MEFLAKLARVQRPMRRLLLSDILVRFCERIPYAWVVIFAMDYIGVSAKDSRNAHDGGNAGRDLVHYSGVALRRSLRPRTVRDRDIYHVHAVSDQSARCSRLPSLQFRAAVSRS